MSGNASFSFKPGAGYSALHHFEENSIVALEAGKIAVLVILELNSLTLNPMIIQRLTAIDTKNDEKHSTLPLL